MKKEKKRSTVQATFEQGYIYAALSEAPHNLH